MDKNIKMISAKLALPYIKDNMIVGLGGGTTIGYVVNFMEKNKVSKIKIVTPSEHTKELCMEAGYEVIDTGMVNHVDIAFDSCDYVDENLYALKSGGGIHTDEKLIARMADDYILLVDESKTGEETEFCNADCFGMYSNGKTLCGDGSSKNWAAKPRRELLMPKTVLQSAITAIC